MTQLRPRLTSACGSPWVATTRLSLTATVDAAAGAAEAARRLAPLDARVARRPAAPAAGRAMPAAAPAAAAADCLMNSRLTHRESPRSWPRGCRRTGRRAPPTARRRCAGCSTPCALIASALGASSVTTSLPLADDGMHQRAGQMPRSPLATVAEPARCRVDDQAGDVQLFGRHGAGLRTSARGARRAAGTSRPGSRSRRRR